VKGCHKTFLGVKLQQSETAVLLFWINAAGHPERFNQFELHESFRPCLARCHMPTKRH